MTPYYESWRTSTHKETACVECHIPPGITSEFRKKYEALAMVARYFTGTYSTSPWAEVDDRSCLRSGCHTKRVLLGKGLYKGILFDHQPHLTEMRRGKKLRCTSCHSQIVQGTHISVTASTCFLCHFKSNSLNEKTARCTLCHEVPEKTIAIAGLSFDHGDVSRFGMNCTACHRGVVRGNGDVPRERCRTCHNNPERLGRIGDTELLHQQHVTDHKVECLNCHIEIRHELPARGEALATSCEVCHEPAARHSAVRDLYRGIGGKGVEPQPATMYLVGVRCEACHDAPDVAPGRASAVSCMSCHGPKYLKIFRGWQTGLQVRLEGVKRELRGIRVRLEKQRDHHGPIPEALARARANVALVETGRGIHNPAYSVSLLDRAHRDLDDVAEALGDSSPRERSWIQAPYEAECLRCHFGIEYLTRPFAGRDFSHGTHTVKARLRCGVCHEGVEKHGVMRIGAEDCDRCHARVAGPMADVPPEECLACHTADLGAVSGKARFPHEKHIAAGLACGFCHTGVTESAHVDFARSGSALPKLGHEFCGSCHAGDVPTEDGIPQDADCAKCHAAF